MKHKEANRGKKHVLSVNDYFESAVQDSAKALTGSP